MVFIPSDNIIFPDYLFVEDNGLLAIGGNLFPETLIKSYKLGIFPWFNEDEPICWFCPNPRFVLYPQNIITLKTMKKRDLLHNYKVREIPCSWLQISSLLNN